MGVGCSCSQENVNWPEKKVYTCIIAVAKNVITKWIEERLPIYQPFLEPTDKCIDQCDYLTNNEVALAQPFITYECSEVDSVPDYNGYCTPCYE